MRRRVQLLRLLALACLGSAGLLLAPERAVAHPLAITAVEATLHPDGQFRILLLTDLDALMFGVAPGELRAGDYLRMATQPPERRAAALGRMQQFYRSRVAVLADTRRLEHHVEFPDLARPPTWPTEAPIPLPGHKVLIEGRFPPGTAAWQFAADPGIGPVLLLRRGPEGEWGGSTFIRPGYLSEPMPTAIGADGSRRMFTGYVRLGFIHILPEGLDHVLFVLALFLLAPRWRPLLWQVGAFTVAHTVTLGLAAAGWIRVDEAIVEPLIALSIAWVGIENLRARSVGWWRVAVVFAFGLLHGLGFAGVLGELGLPRDGFLTALLGFAVGIELGHLAVLALAFAALGWTLRRDWYRARVLRPGSILIALIGAVWLMARLLG